MSEDISWKFRELARGEAEKDPHDDVHFNKGNKAEAIVREFIQNALDVKRDDADRVTVRFTFDTIDQDILENYTEGLEEHLDETDLKPDGYGDGTKRVMAVEDFGTSGLDGPITREEKKEAKQKNPDVKTNFYDFWWKEGKSGKSGSNIGSWGLGKTTYHMASEIKSFWGYTIRPENGDRELLMGKALLKSHDLEGSTYDYAGRYMKGKDLPIEEGELMNQFIEDFPVTRDGEYGFSIVVPYTEDIITPRSVIESAIIHYFYAIMNDDLRIEVRGSENDDPVAIHSENIQEMASEQDWKDTTWENKDVDELMRFTDTAINSIRENELHTLELDQDLSNIPQTEDFEELKDGFNEGELLKLRIPIQIESKKEGVKNSEIFLFLKKYPEDHDMSPDEFYIRRGILLPEETHRRKLGRRSVRGMMVAYDEAVSGFLAGAEEPAHEKLNEDLDAYKNNYDNAVPTLRFIRNSLNKAVQEFDETDQEPMRGLLSDIFSVPKKDEEESEEGTETEGGNETEGGGEPPKERTPQQVDAKQIDGGFEVVCAEKATPPVERRIVVAYDIQRGSPEKNYEKFDFELDEEPIEIENNDVTIRDINENEAKITLNSKESSLKFTGFDRNRDLWVRVRQG